MPVWVLEATRKGSIDPETFFFFALPAGQAQLGKVHTHTQRGKDEIDRDRWRNILQPLSERERGGVCVEQSWAAGTLPPESAD